MTVKPTSAKAPAIRYVLPNELNGEEYARAAYRLGAQKDIMIGDLLHPTSWAHVADKLRQGDMIECVAPDGCWYLRLLVRRIEAPAVHVGVINEIHFDPLPTVAEMAAAAA